ncbi:MAG: PepSY domain-containing protein [Xanthomonadaceae bacterium]|nr:PepSY domain-containing protein [Xanthomonadaceae bacterium]
MKKVLTAIALLGLAASAPALYAQAQNAASAELDAKQIIAKLESAGYTRIEDVEKDDGVWEVEATNSAGQRVELKVDPVTGAVLYEERDDWD